MLGREVPYIVADLRYQGKGYKAESGSHRQMQNSPLFQQGHSLPGRVAASFYTQVDNSGTLPDYRNLHMVT